MSCPPRTIQCTENLRRMTGDLPEAEIFGRWDSRGARVGTYRRKYVRWLRSDGSSFWEAVPYDQWSSLRRWLCDQEHARGLVADTVVGSDNPAEQVGLNALVGDNVRTGST